MSNGNPNDPHDTLAGILDELKQLPCWVLYRIEKRGGKLTKVPINPKTGRNASPTNPQDWATYKTAIAGRNGYAGIGFVFDRSNVLSGIDLDSCRDPQTGVIEQWAREIVRRMNSYTEESPSGKGLHIIARGTLPAGGRRKGRVEMYDHARFFTVTGRRVPGMPNTVKDRQAELVALHAQVFNTSQPQPANQTNTNNVGDGLSEKISAALSNVDDAVIYAAAAAANGEKFLQVFAGDWRGPYPSQSEADHALCAMLAYWAHDKSQIDRIFRTSGLMRPKWDQKRGNFTYGAEEVEKARTQVSQAHQRATDLRLLDSEFVPASLLLTAGAPIAYVSEQMGHSSIELTVKRYGHLIPGANRKYVNNLPGSKSAPQAHPAQGAAV